MRLQSKLETLAGGEVGKLGKSNIVLKAKKVSKNVRTNAITIKDVKEWKSSHKFAPSKRKQTEGDSVGKDRVK